MFTMNQSSSILHRLSLRLSSIPNTFSRRSFDQVKHFTTTRTKRTTFSPTTHTPDERYNTSTIRSQLSRTILPSVSPEEAATRIQLAASYRLFSLFDWNESIENHLTAKIPSTNPTEDSFLVNAYGLHYSEITASSLVKVSLSGKILDPGVTGDTFGINTSGFIIHSAIHRARPDVASVMHCHYPPASGISATSTGLLDLTQTAHQLGPVAYHEYQGVVDDEAEQESLVQDLGEKNVYFLRNHGVITAAESVSATWCFMYQLCKACDMMVAAGGEPFNAFLFVALTETFLLQHPQKVTQTVSPFPTLSWRRRHSIRPGNKISLALHTGPKSSRHICDISTQLIRATGAEVSAKETEQGKQYHTIKTAHFKEQQTKPVL